MADRKISQLPIGDPETLQPGDVIIINRGGKTYQVLMPNPDGTAPDQTPPQNGN